ncbi:MAG: tripartite tricarboxylate transporter TctB family protein [Bacilli bacterium]|nr:tripartite tricarboxylate transporter TctB family protein [Bacilli bacterium]
MKKDLILKKDLISWVILIAFGAYYFIKAIIIPDSDYDLLGPGFFPVVLSIILAGLILADVFITLKLNKNKTSFDNKESDEIKEENYKKNLRSLVLSVILMIVYVSFIPIISFLPATIIYLLIQLWALSPKKGKRKTILVVGISVSASIAIFYIFEIMLKIPLP